MKTFFDKKVQGAEKAEVQEAVPPARVLGAEPPKPCAAALFPRIGAALFAGAGGQSGVFRQSELF